MERSNLFPIFKSNDDKIAAIISNVVRMLSRRIYIDDNGDKHYILSYETTMNNMKQGDKGEYIFKADNGDRYAVKIVFDNITTTGSNSPIAAFMKDYSKHIKIIVASDYKNRIADWITNDGSYIFTEFSMLSDLMANKHVPKFELLSPSEMQLVKKEYGINDDSIKKMKIYDPVTKYFNLGIGDIVRIIRPSPTTGEAVDYRIVVE